MANRIAESARMSKTFDQFLLNLYSEKKTLKRTYGKFFQTIIRSTFSAVFNETSLKRDCCSKIHSSIYHCFAGYAADRNYNDQVAEFGKKLLKQFAMHFEVWWIRR